MLWRTSFAVIFFDVGKRDGDVIVEMKEEMERSALKERFSTSRETDRCQVEDLCFRGAMVH